MSRRTTNFSLFYLEKEYSKFTLCVISNFSALDFLVWKTKVWEIQNSIFTLFHFLRFINFRFSVLSIMTIYLSELKLVNSRLDLGNMMKVILTLKYTVVQLQNFGIRM